MTQEQIFQNIESLLPILQEFHATGSATITIDQKLLLMDLYPQIYPVSRMDVGCGSCVRNYLTMLAAYYDREYPKWVQSQSGGNR